jgi:hypothetical protein
MLMLPLTTVNAGSDVFSADRKPKNKPKTITITKTTATNVLKYSLFRIPFVAVKPLPLMNFWLQLYAKRHG